MTDVDFSIIEECYDFDSVEIIEDTLYTAHYGYIPDDVRSVIMKYFTDKTKLKLSGEIFGIVLSGTATKRSTKTLFLLKP